MSWAQLVAAVRRARWKVRDAAGALVCKAKGRWNYNTPEFRGNCLYFCSRCGKEICGRTFDDLPPMSDEDVEMMHRFNFDEGGRP